MAALKAKSSTEWSQSIEHLGAKLVEAENGVTELEQRRGPDVLAARLGDAAARTRLAKLDDQCAVAEREVRDLRVAISEAGNELRATEEREKAEQRERDRAQAAVLEREAAEIAGKIDQNVLQIGKDATRVQELLARSARLRGRRPAAHRVGYALRASYWDAGLKVGEFVSPSHRRPFSEGLVALLGITPQDDELAA